MELRDVRNAARTTRNGDVEIKFSLSGVTNGQVIRIEREAEQTLLASALQNRTNIEERCCLQRWRRSCQIQNSNHAALLHDKQTVVIARRRRRKQRRTQT